MTHRPLIHFLLLTACALPAAAQDLPRTPFDRLPVTPGTNPFDPSPDRRPRRQPRRPPSTPAPVSPTPVPVPDKKRPAAAPEAPVTPLPAPVAAKGWQRLEIVHGWYTHDKVALLQPECATLATHAALLAAQDLTADVLAEKPEACARGRRLLSLAMHLDPQHAIARRVNECWSDKRPPVLRPPSDDPAVIASFALTAAARVRQAGTPEGESLARCLTEFAADLDPANETAVYQAEVQVRDGKAPPWDAMARGDQFPPEPPPAAAAVSAENSR